MISIDTVFVKIKYVLILYRNTVFSFRKPNYTNSTYNSFANDTNHLDKRVSIWPIDIARNYEKVDGRKTNTLSNTRASAAMCALRMRARRRSNGLEKSGKPNINRRCGSIAQFVAIIRARRILEES